MEEMTTQHGNTQPRFHSWDGPTSIFAPQRMCHKHKVVA